MEKLMIKVYLNDKNLTYEEAPKHFLSASAWAKKYCPSFVGVDMMEVSDVSNEFDHVAEYTFGTEKDANWFKLTWM
jgi:hypothetical protein